MLERETEVLVELWKKTVDVQQHFNDIELKIRNIAIALVAAVIGAAAIAIRESHFLLGGAIFFAGLVGWLAFFLMDYIWYHRLLAGAVKYGAMLEAQIHERVPSLSGKPGLTGSIGEASPYEVPNKWWLFGLKGRKLHSSDKMRTFYSSFAMLLFLGMLLSVSLHVIKAWRSDPPAPAANTTPSIRATPGALPAPGRASQSTEGAEVAAPETADTQAAPATDGDTTEQHDTAGF